MIPETAVPGFNNPAGHLLKLTGALISNTDMENALMLDDALDVLEMVDDAPKPRRRRIRDILRSMAHNLALAAEWMFGAVSLILGLAILAALPVAQFLSMGYFLESSARVARTGRLRDGIF